ncbi:hypothetical protein PSCICN_39600 [Pseudomonas cichorii]|uniref:DUF2845 domain-containing protein n=1 Tax=Pseudomonas cichorii TaxID=36746 RepID=UPI0019104686|nr:DUF2845 domain-containing protein [Pseudomonas cichorii]GFM83268.1 hypothetical protein PSCICN_39600 [Pseudomonas cichorii]
MKRTPIRLAGFILLALSGALAATSAQASTLRCGSQLISTGDRLFEVQQKCGAPVSQEVVGSKETYSSNYRRSEEVRIEEWVYGPDNGMYRYLRFEGGRLVRIDSKRGN